MVYINHMKCSLLWSVLGHIKAKWLAGSNKTPLAPHSKCAGNLIVLYLTVSAHSILISAMRKWSLL